MNQIKKKVSSLLILVLLMGMLPSISFTETTGYQGAEEYLTIRSIEEKENLTEKEILKALIEDFKFSNKWSKFIYDVYVNIDSYGGKFYNKHMATKYKQNFTLDQYYNNVGKIDYKQLQSNVKYSDSPYAAMQSAMNDFGVPNDTYRDKYSSISYMPSERQHTFYTYSSASGDGFRHYLFFYDFKFIPVVNEFELATDNIQPGDKLTSDVTVEYLPTGQVAISKISNPNLEIIDATKEFSYEISKEISHTTTTSITEDYETSTSVSTELKFPAPVDLAGGTAEGTYSYSWGFGTEWSDSITTAESETVTDSITVPLPAQTTVEIEQKSGITEVTVPYSGKTKIVYKVKYLMMHDQNPNTFNQFDYQVFPMASFNGVSGVSKTAMEDIYDRIEDSLIGKDDKDLIDFNRFPFHSFSTAKEHYEYFGFNKVISMPMKGDFKLSTSETTINPLEIKPLYNLYSIEPSLYDLNLMTTDKYELRLLDLEATNRFDVSYYGFNSKVDGEWVVVDSSGEEDLTYAHIQDGLNGKILIADRPGMTYLQFKSNRMPNYETNVSGTDIDPVCSDYITVLIDPIEYTSITITPGLEDMYFNDGVNEIDLSALSVSGIDVENREREPQDLQWCLEESEGITLSQGEMKATVTEPGTYHIYVKHGDTVSNKIEVIVHPQRVLESIQLNGDLPNLIWDDIARASVDLSATLEVLALDQYGDDFLLLPDYHLWKLASESTNNVLATVIGNHLFGQVVGEDSLTLNYLDVESNRVLVKIISKPYMKEITFEGDAPVVLEGVDYDLNQVAFKALDQYFEIYEMSPEERASLIWTLSEDSELEGLVENGLLKVTSPMEPGDKKTIKLDATLQGEKELFEIPGILLNVETVPELAKLVIVPPADFSMRVSENANLSLMELLAYDQYGRLFDITEEAVIWQSSDTEVIDIVNNAVLHALKEDIEVEITAEVSGVNSEPVTMMIKAVPRLKKIRIFGTPSQVYTNSSLNLSTIEVKGYDQYDEEYSIEDQLERVTFSVARKITEASLSSDIVSFGSLEGIVGLNAKIDGTTFSDDVNIFIVKKPVSNNSSSGTKKNTSSSSTKNSTPSIPSEEIVVIDEEETPEAASPMVLKGFEDMTGYEWAKEAVESLANDGIIEGVSETRFAPGREITRGEFVTLIIRFFNLSSSNAEMYPDVEPDMYYAETLITSRALGITEAYDDGTFKPDEAITRQDMMVVIYNSLMVTEEFLNLIESHETYLDFDDADSVKEEAIEAVDYLVSTDIINGNSNRLDPEKTSNRAQAAQMLYNMYQILGVN